MLSLFMALSCTLRSSLAFSLHSWHWPQLNNWNEQNWNKMKLKTLAH